MSTQHRSKVLAASPDPFGFQTHAQHAQKTAATDHSQPIREPQVNPLWMITVALFSCLLLIALAMSS
jgi:hypothetical protein